MAPGYTDWVKAGDGKKGCHLKHCSTILQTVYMMLLPPFCIYVLFGIKIKQECVLPPINLSHCHICTYVKGFP